MTSIILSTDPTRLDLGRIHGWLRDSYWSPGIRRDVVERAFARSSSVGAYDGAHDGAGQVGVARVVTDEATFAYVCDVYVAASHRGRGIARSMVRILLADERMQTIRRFCLATRDAHEVYRGLGFTPVNPTRWMELLPPRASWSEA